MSKSRSEEMAEQHVAWFMKNVRMILDSGTAIMEKMLIDHFVHGFKHGVEFMRDCERDE